MLTVGVTAKKINQSISQVVHVLMQNGKAVYLTKVLNAKGVAPTGLK